MLDGMKVLLIYKNNNIPIALYGKLFDLRKFVLKNNKKNELKFKERNVLKALHYV